jgi:hypothetical protein
MLISFLVLLISLTIYFGSGFIIKGGDTNKIIETSFLGISVVKFHYLVLVSIIAPTILFYSLKFLFIIKKTVVSFYIKFFTIAVLFFSGLTNSFFENELWVFMMALSIQLILYQKELSMMTKFEN